MSPPSLPIVVIAGRPNVGKSTLFNRLAGRRIALVADTPGVTRDRKEAEAQLRGRMVRLIDTAGLEEAAPETLAGRMRAGSATAVEQADLVLFVLDSRTGVTPADAHFAQWLRRQGKPVLLVANKAEGRARHLRHPRSLFPWPGRTRRRLGGAWRRRLRPDVGNRRPPAPPTGTRGPRRRPPAEAGHRRPPERRQVNSDQSPAGRGPHDHRPRTRPDPRRHRHPPVRHRRPRHRTCRHRRPAPPRPHRGPAGKDVRQRRHRGAENGRGRRPHPRRRRRHPRPGPANRPPGRA